MLGLTCSTSKSISSSVAPGRREAAMGQVLAGVWAGPNHTSGGLPSLFFLAVGASPTKEPKKTPARPQRAGLLPGGPARSLHRSLTPSLLSTQCRDGHDGRGRLLHRPKHTQDAAANPAESCHLVVSRRALLAAALSPSSPSSARVRGRQTQTGSTQSKPRKKQKKNYQCTPTPPTPCPALLKPPRWPRSSRRPTLCWPCPRPVATTSLT